MNINKKVLILRNYFLEIIDSVERIDVLEKFNTWLDSHSHQRVFAD